MHYRRNCEDRDYLTIYNSPDGSGHPRLYPVCSYSSGTDVLMEGSTAYIVYHTDHSNAWGDYGEEGFNATFVTEGLLLKLTIIM